MQHIHCCRLPCEPLQRPCLASGVGAHWAVWALCAVCCGPLRCTNQAAADSRFRHRSGLQLHSKRFRLYAAGQDRARSLPTVLHLTIQGSQFRQTRVFLLLPPSIISNPAVN